MATISMNFHQPLARGRAATSIAPAWHTFAVLLAIGAMILASRIRHGSIDGHDRIARYMMMAVTEWAITAWVWFGCRSQGSRFRELMGTVAAGWRRVLLDLGLALGFLVASNVVLALAFACCSTQGRVNRAVLDLLPHNEAELAAFLLLSLTAAFCEEIIYRGYLQAQFTALSGYWWIGVLLQGLVFGVSHSYQGLAMTLSISLYGCLFGFLAHWRRNLRPGMIAHFVQDGICGIILGSANQIAR